MADIKKFIGLLKAGIRAGETKRALKALSQIKQLLPGTTVLKQMEALRKQGVKFTGPMRTMLGFPKDLAEWKRRGVFSKAGLSSPEGKRRALKLATQMVTTMPLTIKAVPVVTKLGDLSKSIKIINKDKLKVLAGDKWHVITRSDIKNYVQPRGTGIGKLGTITGDWRPIRRIFSDVAWVFDQLVK